jgi:hypothetical protein
VCIFKSNLYFFILKVFFIFIYTKKPNLSPERKKRGKIIAGRVEGSWDLDRLRAGRWQEPPCLLAGERVGLEERQA